MKIIIDSREINWETDLYGSLIKNINGKEILITFEELQND